MTEKVESLPHDGGFIVSEANGSYSREGVTVAQAAEVIKAGTVMGKRANGKYYQLDPDATTGEEDVAAILYGDVDSTDGDAKGAVILRHAEVRANDLTWPDGISTGQQDTAEAQLKALGIIIRTGPTRISTQEF